MTDHTWIRVPTEAVKDVATGSIYDAPPNELIDACRSALNQEVVELEGELEQDGTKSPPLTIVTLDWKLVQGLEPGPVRILIVREGE